MSWYWLDHTVIQSRVIYLFLTKHLVLIDDIIGLIHHNMKQLLNPWYRITHIYIEIDYQLYLIKKYLTYCVYLLDDIKPNAYFYIDFDVMQARSEKKEIKYKLMRIETS